MFENIKLIQEYLVGFDIRFDKITQQYAKNLDAYPHIEKVRAACELFWQSRFYPIRGKSPYELLKELQFREPTGKNVYLHYVNMYRAEDDDMERIAVPLEYCWNYAYNGLWGVLNNMLSRYIPDPAVDTVAAFTVFEFSKDKAFECNGEDIYSEPDFRGIRDGWGEKSTKNTPLSRKENWEFLGFDVGDAARGNYLFTRDDLEKGLQQIENYYTFKIRNKFALFDRLEDALYECFLVNKYNDDICPFYVWGVYKMLNNS